MANDYLSGSQFGNVAGALLARKRRQDKDQARRALFASALFETVGAFQRRQQTNLKEDIENINTQYQDIFVNNQEEWNGAQVNRQAIAEADRIGEKAYLNKRVNENIDYLLEDLGVSWKDKNMQTPEIQDKMIATYNDQLKREKEILDLLRQNPVNTYNTFSQYNQAAKNEYLAALAAVKDDPTRKGLVAAAFNRIFRTEKDAEGNLTSTNAAKIELEDALNFAKQERKKFRDGVNAAETLLNNHYSGFVGKPAEELENNIVPLARKPFTDTQILNQIKLNNTHLEDEDFMKIPLNIPVLKTGVTIENIKDIPELNEDNIEEVNIKKAWKDKKIKVYNPDTQELSTISSFEMKEILAKQALSLNDIRMKNGINPTVGAGIINESFQSFANEGRFLRLKQLTKGGLNLSRIGLDYTIGGETQWDADDILFIAPSQTGQNLLRNKVSVSDAVAINQSQGSNRPEDIVKGEDIEGPPEYDGLTVLDFLQSENFITNSRNNQIESINELKESYPDRAEEIDNLYDLVLKSQSSEQKTKTLDNSINKIKSPETESERMARFEKNADALMRDETAAIAENISSFFKSQQGKADLNKLERYADGNYRNTVVIKELFRKYGLDEDSSPEDVADFLDNFNPPSSLLARQ